jgi:hypothetical protein
MEDGGVLTDAATGSWRRWNLATVGSKQDFIKKSGTISLE